MPPNGIVFILNLIQFANSCWRITDARALWRTTQKDKSTIQKSENATQKELTTTQKDESTIQKDESTIQKNGEEFLKAKTN